MEVVKINNQSLNVGIKNNVLFVNDKEVPLETLSVGEGKFILYHKNKVYELEILSQTGNQAYEIRLNHKRVMVEVKGSREVLLEKLGMKQIGKEEIKDIKAPMPGMILEINVKPGDLVEKNDLLLVLEAMKMENTIKSPKSGTISSVKVKVGEGVEKNQLLIQF